MIKKLLIGAVLSAAMMGFVSTARADQCVKGPCGSGETVFHRADIQDNQGLAFYQVDKKGTCGLTAGIGDCKPKN